MSPDHFSPRQLRIVSSSLEDAEHRVSSFYRIAPREWSLRFPYDLATLEGHHGPGFEPGALAQVLRLTPGSPGRRARFRIVLRDPAILRMGRRHGIRRTLLWVLSHELIHVVRFAQSPARFEARGAGQRREEGRVLELTRRVLAPEEDPRLKALLRRMDPLSLGAAAEGPPGRSPRSRPAGNR